MTTQLNHQAQGALAGAALIFTLAACTSTSQPPPNSGFSQSAWTQSVSPEERAAAADYQKQQADLRNYSQQKLANKNKAEARTAEAVVDTELALRKATVERGELKGYYRTGSPDAVNIQNIDNSNNNSNSNSAKATVEN
ncbi:MAG: hypothetical protein LBK76_02380 [Verrucomicrobiales bacterium]|nr:hypothetical protein [Verrucomicrobiales bacterium]